MKDIQYQITFFSPWHCGSGQAAGADVDELAIKDHDGLPFIPGRTIKGLLRDACDELRQYSKLQDNKVIDVFGYDPDMYKDDPDKAEPYKDKASKGCAFFSDATLPEAERATILQEKDLKQYLYRSVSSTAIGNDGIAKDHSLRKIETVVPCTLEGKIQNVPEDFVDSLQKAMSLTKRLGLGRTHGLGRCEFKTTKIEERS